jgi:hypothetical protein
MTFYDAGVEPRSLCLYPSRQKVTEDNFELETYLQLLLQWRKYFTFISFLLKQHCFLLSRSGSVQQVLKSTSRCSISRVAMARIYTNSKLPTPDIPALDLLSLLFGNWFLPMVGSGGMLVLIRLQTRTWPFRKTIPSFTLKLRTLVSFFNAYA